MKVSYIITILKISVDLCAIRQKIKIKNTFADIVYNFLRMEKYEKEEQQHEKVFLKINGKQSVKLKRFSIKLKNCFEQLARPFKF